MSGLGSFLSTSNGQASDGADESTPLVSQGNGGKPLYEDERAWVRWPALVLHKTWQVLASSYVNVLLVFVPAGIILGALGLDPTAVFIVNFLAIIPLAALLSFATEELSVKLGQTIGGLMNATFGNAVELIVSHFLCIASCEANRSHPRSPSLLCAKERFASFSRAC